jgi:hypothetical protein
MSILKNISEWTAPKCEGCGNRLFRASSYAHELRVNYDKHKQSDQFVASARFLCHNCFLHRELALCAKTGDIFFKRDDKLSEYRSGELYRNLHPHHLSGNIYGSLSPKGIDIIGKEHEEVQARFSNWTGGTRSERLRGFSIVKELGVIREDDEYNDPAEVELALKWHAVQIGGNGFIKFFWDKQIKHHEEEYVAGHGPKGNAYYRTRHWTTTYFTGHAVCIIAEPIAKATPQREGRKDDRRLKLGGGDDGPEWR